MRKPTLYKHRGNWYARFWNPDKGRYYARSLGIKAAGKKGRKSEALEAVLKMAAEGSAPKPAEPPPDNAAPLTDYALAFWQSDGEYAREKALVEKKPVSKHYLLANRRAVITKAVPYPGFEGVTLGSLTKPLIRKWKIWLAEQGCSGRTINTALQSIRVPVKRAYADDLIPADPFFGVPRASHAEKTRGILTPAEIRRLVSEPVTNPYSRLAVYLPIYCSMRMGEVRGLQWGDISDGVIHIRHNWQDGEGVKKCKCGSEGYVPLPRVVAAALNSVWEAAPLRGGEDFVMSLTPHKPVSKEKLTVFFRSELESIGIGEGERKRRNIVYHSLRHSFVTACRVAGLTDFETMTLARHKDRKMLERYSHGKEALDLTAMRDKLETALLPDTAGGCEQEFSPTRFFAPTLLAGQARQELL